MCTAWIKIIYIITFCFYLGLHNFGSRLNSQAHNNNYIIYTSHNYVEWHPINQYNACSIYWSNWWIKSVLITEVQLTQKFVFFGFLLAPSRCKRQAYCLGVVRIFDQGNQGPLVSSFRAFSDDTSNWNK